MNHECKGGLVEKTLYRIVASSHVCYKLGNQLFVKRSKYIRIKNPLHKQTDRDVLELAILQYICAIAVLFLWGLITYISHSAQNKLSVIIKCHGDLWARLPLNWIVFFFFVKFP